MAELFDQQFGKRGLERAEALPAEPGEHLIHAFARHSGIDADEIARFRPPFPPRRLAGQRFRIDRKSVVSGTSVSVSLDIGGSLNIKKKTTHITIQNR